jgi:hypothetical protein
VDSNEAFLPSVLLELPPNVRHICTAALHGATALAYFTAAGQPVKLARGCTAVHTLDSDSSQRVVSSVVQLLLEAKAPLAEPSSTADSAQTAASLVDVLCEDTAAQTLPESADCRLPSFPQPAEPTSAPRHQPGQWQLPPHECNASPQRLKPGKSRSRGACLTLQLAHALQAAHAAPAALGPEDPMHLAALLRPRKAGPPRLPRRKPAKRSSDQLQHAAAGELGGSGLAWSGSRNQQLSRADALQSRLQQAKRPAWARPMSPEHDQQEQDLLNFVSEL